MGRRRWLRPQRQRVFVGCEGPSERSYVRLLQSFADQNGLHLHLDAELLNPGAGDPLQLVRRAIVKIAAKDSGRPAQDRYRLRVVLLDADRLSDGSAIARDALKEAAAAKITLLASRPNYAAFLLRHLPGRHHDDPPQGDTLRALQRHWPEYRKPMPFEALVTRITWEGVRQVCQVDRVFADFLRCLGFRP